MEGGCSNNLSILGLLLLLFSFVGKGAVATKTIVYGINLLLINHFVLLSKPYPSP